MAHCDCGFCVGVVTNSVGTLLVDWVAKPVKRELDYVRHFHENVEKLRRKKEEVEMARTRLQHEIEEAERRLQQIENDVRHYRSKAEEILGLEIAETKSCFSCCPNWWWRYRLSKELEKKTLPDISNLLEKMATFGQLGRPVGYRDPSTIPTIEFLVSKDFLVSKSSKAASDQIIAALKDDNVSIIALWGMGGVGKTTLVHQVGNQAKKLNLFDKVVFATVSKKPNSEAIQDEIAKYLDFNMRNEQGRISKQEFWSRLKKENRILIILDDVWGEINLKADIGLPFGEDHKGCKILITTRRLQVCKSMNCQKEIPLGCLDEDEAWVLFETKAGLRNSDEAIKKVATEVIKKCQGLPISIVTLGTALKGNTLARWKVTCRKLKTRKVMNIEDISEKNAYLCLEVSFDYLNDMETKICFLLCSLFPEDYEIYVEELVRYAWGLDLYKGIVDSIEEVRSEVHAAIGILKDSSLLLDCGERHVKMHDTVRDVALWIASNRKDIAFEIKSGVVETWPKNECFDSCTALSYMTSPIVELPDGLVCPNLRILLLGGDGSNLMGTRSAFFEGMKTLQVCSLQDRLISPHAFQFQINLRTLHLKSCNFSVLGQLKKLHVLSITWSDIEELPDEVGDLNNLRLLELSNCQSLRRIPPHLIQRLSHLEELYLDGCGLIRWATEDTTQKGGYASLWELNSLSKLKVLSLWVVSDQIPKDFVFQKLQRFDICVNNKGYDYFPISRSLSIKASELDAFQQLIWNAETLDLENLMDCRNLVGGLELDQEAFSKLTYLGLNSCKDMKCLIDTLKESRALTIAFPNLVKLSIRNMYGLEEFCHGPQPRGFLQNLKALSLWGCNDIISPIPILQNLEEVDVLYCDKLQVLFQSDELIRNQEEPILRSIQASLELRSIQQRPIEHVNLHNLKIVTIDTCNKMRYLFPASVAKSLGQLERLDIRNCLELKEIIQKTEASNVCLQSLKEVTVIRCDNLTSLSSLSHGQVLENLTTLVICDCSGLEYTFPFSTAESLPQLKVVKLQELPQLKGMDGNDIVLTLSSLQYLSDLSLRGCPQLSIPSFTSLSKIQELHIIEMTCPKELFDGGNNFSSLKRLRLIELPELHVIWIGPMQVVNFQNLTQLTVRECKKLRYVFSAIIARNLPQLSSLETQDCEELEQIIGKDETSSQDHYLQPICFPNLTYIYVAGCENLKSLFSVSTGLPKLKSLFFVNIPKLEQVFEGGDAANVSMANEDQVIELPRLDLLYLKRLPNVVRLSPVGYHFIFPSLQKLVVRDCPNITTGFSVDSRKRGHAKTEATESIGENIMEESAVAQQTTCWPIGHDIEWPYEEDEYSSKICEEIDEVI